MDTDAPTIDHADEQILESWNAIREGSQDEGAEAAKPAEATTPSTEAKETSSGPARDAAGKFAKAEPAVELPAAEPATDSLIPVTPPEPKMEGLTAIDSPRSMPKELADKHWSTLPTEVKAWTQKRDADYEAGIGRYRQRAEGFDRVEAAAAPYRATLERLQATPDVALATFLSMDDVLRNGAPEAKAAMLAQLANQFGVSLQEVANVGPLQQQLLAREQEVRALRSQQTTATEQQAQRELDALTSEVVRFSEGKEHFGAVQKELMALLPQVAAENPNASPVEKLQRAYDIAIYANPTTRAAIDAQQREAARQDALKKATEAKRTASVNRTPRGVVPAVAAVGSMEDTIRATAERLGMV